MTRIKLTLLIMEINSKLKLILDLVALLFIPCSVHFSNNMFDSYIHHRKNSRKNNRQKFKAVAIKSFEMNQECIELYIQDEIPNNKIISPNK